MGISSKTLGFVGSWCWLWKDRNHSVLLITFICKAEFLIVSCFEYLQTSRRLNDLFLSPCSKVSTEHLRNQRLGSVISEIFSNLMIVWHYEICGSKIGESIIFFISRSPVTPFNDSINYTLIKLIPSFITNHFCSTKKSISALAECRN